MADILCGYTADRDETLVAYVYGDIDAAQRTAFDAHLATCERCRHELNDLQGVRAALQQWTAPLVSGVPLTTTLIPLAADSSAGIEPRRRPWREVPAWAQVAAALLFLGVSAGVANLDVRYDSSGLSIRTGWSRARLSSAAPSTATAPSPNATSTDAGAAAPWRADLEALERRLRTDARASAAAASATRDGGAASAATFDAQLLRKVRTLLDDSERRQRNELALRIAEVVQEFDTKRGSDLANIRTLRNAQTATGVEIVRQQQYLDLLRQASISMQR